MLPPFRILNPDNKTSELQTPKDEQSDNHQFFKLNNMKTIYTILSLTILTVSGCRFQPNNSEGIIVLKHTDDTLSLSILDSYYRISKYKTVKKDDTLYIEVLSISSPDTVPKPDLIPIDTTIKYIKLQSDTIIDVQKIPFPISH